MVDTYFVGACASNTCGCLSPSYIHCILHGCHVTLHVTSHSIYCHAFACKHTTINARYFVVVIATFLHRFPPMCACIPYSASLSVFSCAFRLFLHTICPAFMGCLHCVTRHTGLLFYCHYISSTPTVQWHHTMSAYAAHVVCCALHYSTSPLSVYTISQQPKRLHPIGCI